MDRGYACRGKVGDGRDCDEVGSGAAGVVVFKRRLEKLFARGFLVGRGLAPESGLGSFLPLSGVVVQRAGLAVGGWGGGPPAVHHLQYVGFPKGGNESKL